MDTDNDAPIYPIPLSDGRIVTLRNMPIKLSEQDAERICRVVKALTQRDQSDD